MTRYPTDSETRVRGIRRKFTPSLSCPSTSRTSFLATLPISPVQGGVRPPLTRERRSRTRDCNSEWNFKRIEHAASPFARTRSTSNQWPLFRLLVRTLRSSPRLRIEIVHGYRERYLRFSGLQGTTLRRATFSFPLASGISDDESTG